MVKWKIQNYNNEQSHNRERCAGDEPGARGQRSEAGEERPRVREILKDAGNEDEVGRAGGEGGIEGVVKREVRTGKFGAATRGDLGLLDDVPGDRGERGEEGVVLKPGAAEGAAEIEHAEAGGAERGEGGELGEEERIGGGLGED